jgi:hypothetical protein
MGTVKGGENKFPSFGHALPSRLKLQTSGRKIPIFPCHPAGGRYTRAMFKVADAPKTGRSGAQDVRSARSASLAAQSDPEIPARPVGKRLLRRHPAEGRKWQVPGILTTGWSEFPKCRGNAVALTMLATCWLCASFCVSVAAGAENADIPYSQKFYDVECGQLPVHLDKEHPAIDLNLNIPASKVAMKRLLWIAGLCDDIQKGCTGFVKQACFLGDAVEKPANGKSILRITGENNVFPRKTYGFLRKNRDLPESETVAMALDAKADDLKVMAGGDCGVKLEFYANADDAATEKEPDKTVFVPFKVGTYGWTTLSSKIDIPKGMTAVMISLGGEKFSGTIRLRAPRIKCNGKPANIPDFDECARFWLDLNLSRVFWPRFSLSVDGKEFYRGACFQRGGNGGFVDFERGLPPLSAGQHKLTIKLASDWPGAKGYTLKKVGYMAEPARAFELVGAPEFVPEKSEFRVAVEINRAETTLKLAGENAAPAEKSMKFENPGLYGLVFKAGEPGLPAKATISDGGHVAAADIRFVTSGRSDDILLSTSDWVYVTHAMTDEYFKWQMHNDMVNSVVIRPSYLWSGIRTCDESYYRHVKRLCETLRLPYALMVEGRNMAATHINPLDEWIDGPLYLGRQSHEDDGSFYYWGGGSRPYPNGLLLILMGRYLDGGGIYPKFQFRGDAARDMKEGAGYFVSNLRRAKHGSTRHTGPSSLFRYFYQAGYDWLGSEQCYGPEAFNMSALRGASRAYGKTRYGTHHATQWGYRGYCSDGHVEAQFKTEGVAYIQGSSHINNEDSIWNTEECDFRFSPWTRKHIARQKDILDFIRTHRRGKRLVAPIAIIHGRYDGWASFRYHSLWGQSGPEWVDGDSEKSYSLLSVFFPHRQGDTPYGPVDYLPVEASGSVMAQYDALMFLGWNSFVAEDFDRLGKYVENGGTVLLTKAHLNTNPHHNQPVTLPEGNAFVDRLLAKGGGSADSPAVIAMGKGRVILFNTDKYPGNEEIHDAYGKEMRKLGEEAARKQRGKGWVSTGSALNYAVWEQEPGENIERILYMLNLGVGGAKQPKLLLGEAEYSLSVPGGVVSSVYISNGIAAYPSDHLSSILGIKQLDGAIEVTVQAVNAGTVRVFRGSAGAKVLTVSVPGPGIHVLKVAGK